MREREGETVSEKRENQKRGGKGDEIKNTTTEKRELPNYAIVVQAVAILKIVWREREREYKKKGRGRRAVKEGKRMEARGIEWIGMKMGETEDTTLV